MKVRAKVPFFDAHGLHKRGDIVDVAPSEFNADRMEQIVDEKKVEAKKVETAEKKVAKKITRKKG